MPSVRILDIADITHNVRRYRLERPAGYDFQPGQATEVALDEAGWRDKRHPFTFTGLTSDPHLEFTIKSYFNTGGDGVTERLYHYQSGHSLLIHDVWGTITYKGPGVFIAGGAGVTPFIAILRDLNAKGRIAGHTLIVSNRTEGDIILRREFESFKGLNVIWTVTDDPSSKLPHDRVDAVFLKSRIRDFSQNFYLCGPDAMVADLKVALAGLGADVENVTFET